MIQHRTLGFGSVCQPFDESRKHFGMVALDLYQLVLLSRNVSVM